jgi:hypothetical protein
MSAAKQFALEATQLLFTEAGILTKRNKDGDLLVQCTDATFDYLTGDRAPYLAPLLCRCPQRDYPHELSAHSRVRYEKPGTYFVWDGKQESLVEFADSGMRWPWSLKLSVREEPSTERSAA